MYNLISFCSFVAGVLESQIQEQVAGLGVVPIGQLATIRVMVRVVVACGIVGNLMMLRPPPPELESERRSLRN